MSKNLISIEISDDDTQEINAAINTLQTKFIPYLIALTTDDKQALPKVKDKSLAFMQKAAGYMETNPEFMPQFLDKPEFEKDFAGFTQIRSFLRQLMPLISNLEDTAFLCGAESYRACLNYYDSVKLAVKMNVPNAKAIYEDLSVYFDAQRAKPQRPAS